MPARPRRRVAGLDHALLRHRRQQADGDGVPHIHVVGEAAGEVKPLDSGGIDAERAHDDVLPAVVGGLGLAQVAGVLLGEGDPVLRHHGHFLLLAVGGEDALGGEHVGPPKLRQQVDEAGAAQPHRLFAADGLVGGLAVFAKADRLDGAVAGRHAVAHQPALERRPRRAGGRKHPAPLLDHDLGVRTHVDQHRGIGVGEAFFQRHEGGCGVAADVARDERQPVDAGCAIGAQAQPQRAGAERRVRALAGEEGVLDGGLVGLLADPLHIQLEQDVAHG